MTTGRTSWGSDEPLYRYCEDDMSPQDTDKLEAIVDRGADLIELAVKRLSDGWQPFTDAPVIAAFFLEKETRDVIGAYKEIGDEARDLKPHEIARLIRMAAERTEDQLTAAYNANPSGDGPGATLVE